jgi:hypothetical protein
MTKPDDHQRDELLEAYLDGQLNSAQRAAFEESLRSNPALRRQVAVQAQVNEALVRLFAVETPSIQQVVTALGGAAEESAGQDAEATRAYLKDADARSASSREGQWSMPRSYWMAMGVAAAAALACVATAILWNRPSRDEPYFAVRPLVDVYRDAVASGFEPSYECREPDRFAATFRERQGQPLVLLAMPSSSNMLGLSYVNALSRRTTAMLCRVDGQPVIVFVDRAEHDQPLAAAKGADGLRVFREQRDGLVFYEVTPLNEPRVTKLLAPIENGAGAPAAG